MIDPNATGRRLGTYKSAAKKTGVSVDVWIAKQLSGQVWCYRCREWKEFAEVAKDKSRASGHQSICKPCMALACTASRYGMTRDGLLEFIKPGCAICGKTKTIYVDHCHKTGRLREPLCPRCNSGIGAFDDDPEKMRKAIDYLEKHNGRKD